jgi:hypothetical protein
MWGGWLTVRPAALTPGKRLVTRRTGGWVDPLRLGTISRSSGFEIFASENERLINHKVLVQSLRIVVVEKAFSLFKYLFHHVGTYIKLLLHIIAM